MPTAESLAKAAEVLPCTGEGCHKLYKDPADIRWLHTMSCGAPFRPVVAAALDAERARAEAVVKALKRIARFASPFGPSDEARIAEAAVAEWEAR